MLAWLPVLVYHLIGSVALVLKKDPVDQPAFLCWDSLGAVDLLD